MVELASRPRACIAQIARAEEKIENEEREIEHLRAQIEKLRRML